YSMLVFLVGYSQRRFEEGTQLDRLAQAALGHAGGGDEIDAWRPNSLARMYAAQGKQLLPLEAYKRAAPSDERAGGTDWMWVGLERNMIDPLVKLGRYAEANAKTDRALAMLERMLGPNHPDTAKMFISRGGIALEQGRFEDAIAAAQKALSAR